MGKTHRFSPEDDDFGYQDHRIRRADILEARRAMARSLRPLLPEVVIVPVTVFDDGYIPDKASAEASPENAYYRGLRLDLIHELGEHMLQDELQ